MNNRIKELEEINEEHRKLNGELRKENQQLKEKLNRLENVIYNNGCYRTIEKNENGEYVLEFGEYSTYKTKDLLDILNGDRK